MILAAMALTCLMAVTACGDDDNSYYDTYEEWGKPNEEWYQQQKSMMTDGEFYYKRLQPSWLESSGTLIHYFNDRKLTEGNLSPMANSTVKVKYRGQFYNGVGFDSSYTETDSTRTFTLGPDLILGWRVALNDMRVGDSADIIVPWIQAYGYTGSTGVPGYSNLKFSIKLVDIPDYEKRQ